MLALERIHFDRQFGGTDDVRQVQKFPARHLSAITQIRIFGQRVVLPAARGFDRLPPPDSGSAIEIEKASGEVAAAVFDDEMAVQNDGFHLRQKRIFAVDVSPTHLHHSDFAIAEVIDNIFEKVRRRNKVGIENRDQLTCGGL